MAQGREHERAVAVAAESPAAPSRLRWLRKGELLILGGFIVLLLPWAFYLAYSLPSRHVTPHWDAAWAGFDLMMAGAAAWTVASIVRRSAYLSVAASVTGAFLVCDAWFDILTSRPGSELVTSGLFALFGELPLAALCFWIASDAERMHERTDRYLESRRPVSTGESAGD